MSIEDFPEVLSQRILLGIILVGRLGVGSHMRARRPDGEASRGMRQARGREYPVREHAFCFLAGPSRGPRNRPCGEEA